MNRINFFSTRNIAAKTSKYRELAASVMSRYENQLDGTDAVKSSFILPEEIPNSGSSIANSPGIAFSKKKLHTVIGTLSDKQSVFNSACNFGNGYLGSIGSLAKVAVTASFDTIELDATSPSYSTGRKLTLTYFVGDFAVDDIATGGAGESLTTGSARRIYSEIVTVSGVSGNFVGLEQPLVRLYEGNTSTDTTNSLKLFDAHDYISQDMTLKNVTINIPMIV